MGATLASRLVLKVKSTANFVLDDVKPVVSDVQTATLETTKGNLTLDVPVFSFFVV